MHYKTIVLGLLQDRPELHRSLQVGKTLLSALDRCAEELRSIHEAWTNCLLLARPGSDRSQVATEALEIAVKDLEDRLLSGSGQAATEHLSLDEAMAFIRRRTPHA